LKLASSILFLASEGDLRLLVAEQAGNLLVHNVANLVVVFHNLSVLIADTRIPSRHQRIASLVTSADVAVDSGPTFVALALIAGSHRSVPAPSKRATD
jgi:hypothetical protein